MHLVIDTYNVLHVVGVLPREIAGIDTADLIELLGRSRYRGRRIILVCDGVPPPGAPEGLAGSISVHYSGPCRSADERIAAIIRQSSAPRRLTIVSSDRGVIREARRRRCTTLDSADLLRHLAEDHLLGRPDPVPVAKPPGTVARAGAALPNVLPPELIAEAEMMAELEPEEPITRPPEPDRPPEQGEGATGPQAVPGFAGLRLDDLDLGDLAETDDREAAIPRDILAEAEELWRTGGREPRELDEEAP